MTTISTIDAAAKLHNGLEMPWLGLGVFKIEDGQPTIDAVQAALEAGYRHIDTAAVYGNEGGVGDGVRNSGIPREEVFVTTKIWNEDQRNDNVEGAFEASLSRLGMPHVDLLLVHWPVKGKYKQTWKHFERFYEQGRAKAIGVSNFLQHHLEDLLDGATITPMVNQLEFHPRLVQKDLLQFCRDHRIQYEAWSPLMQGQFDKLDDLKPIAERHGKTIPQIILRWNLQHEVVTIPKSSKPGRIRENADIFDFELSDDEMTTIDAQDQNHRIGPDPDNFSF